MASSYGLIISSLAQPMSSTKIAFTSCARYQPHVPQVAWDAIAQADPDYLLLLGDQIYMDFGLWPFSREPQGAPKRYTVAKFASVMREKYERQWAEPHFRRLLAQMRAKNGLFGVWDDHDFAWNNAYGNDATQPRDAYLQEKKEIARALFHEFMNCATRPPEIYGCVDTAHARLIFLDNRFYATPLSAPSPVLMGQQQMEFLASKLQHDRTYTLICGGLTLMQSAENWSKYTQEFDQFKRVIASVPRPIYLGGDIHKNMFTAPSADGRPPCYEIVSSGVCVNILGLPFEFDRRRNWTLLELDAQGVRVNQYDKKGVTRWRIDHASWRCEPLGREVASA